MKTTRFFVLLFGWIFALGNLLSRATAKHSSVVLSSSSDTNDDYTSSSSEWTGVTSHRPSVAPSVSPTVT
ncbi:hypothetical protein EON65_44525, partial [archaeon]